MKKKITIAVILTFMMLLTIQIKPKASSGFWYNYLGSTIDLYSQEEDDSILLEIKTEYITNNGNTLNFRYMYGEIQYQLGEMGWNGAFSLEMYLSLLPNVNMVNNELIVKSNLNMTQYGYLYFGDEVVYNINFINDLYINTINYPLSQTNSLKRLEIQDAFVLENYDIYSSIQEITFNPNVTIESLNKIIEQQQNTINEQQSIIADQNENINALNIALENITLLYQDLDEQFNEFLSGSVGLPQLIITYIDIPIKVIQGFLGFEVFGINLFKALSGVLTLGLILFLLKKLF